MFTLNYKTRSEDVQIRFAVLHDAFIAARALDPLKTLRAIADLRVSDEADPDRIYLIPSLVNKKDK